MIKHLFAIASTAALLAGCAVNTDSTADDDDTGEAEQAITSFFGSGDATASFCSTGTPIVKNPGFNANGAVLVDAAGSCIMQGATMKLLVPWSTTVYGPFTMGWDQSGTRLKANVGSTFPVGSCRIVVVTNPNGKESNYASLCH